MEGVTVDQVDGVVEENYFEKKVAANRLGNFVIKQLCHAQKFFFVQMFVILLLLSLCIVKLTVLKPNCEETSVWISIFSSLVGYILPNPEL